MPYDPVLGPWIVAVSLVAVLNSLALLWMAYRLLPVRALLSKFSRDEDWFERSQTVGTKARPITCYGLDAAGKRMAVAPGRNTILMYLPARSVTSRRVVTMLVELTGRVPCSAQWVALVAGEREQARRFVAGAKLTERAVRVRGPGPHGSGTAVAVYVDAQGVVRQVGRVWDLTGLAVFVEACPNVALRSWFIEACMRDVQAVA
jgi:hypothetical protein